MTILHGLDFSATPRDRIVVRPVTEPQSWNAGETGIKPGHLVNYTSAGLFLVDITALIGDRILEQFVVEIPEMPLGARTDPMYDYSHANDEMLTLYELAKNMICFIRCKDDVGTIDWGQVCENCDVNQGMITGMVADAAVAAGATAVTGDADAATLEGEVIPRQKFRSLDPTQRAKSATESLLLVKVI
jgi:hypothetical protein